MKTLSRPPELEKAFAYALNQWVALSYYTEDGWAEADNDIAENALQMVSLHEKTIFYSVRITEVNLEPYCTDVQIGGSLDIESMVTPVFATLIFDDIIGLLKSIRRLNRASMSSAPDEPLENIRLQ